MLAYYKTMYFSVCVATVPTSRRCFPENTLGDFCIRVIIHVASCKPDNKELIACATAIGDMVLASLFGEPFGQIKANSPLSYNPRLLHKRI